MNKNYIGFVYRIDYIGNNEIIKNLSYAGYKKITSKLKWENYFGSPSKKNCIKCLEWKKESKIHPEDFKKQIISFVKYNILYFRNNVHIFCNSRRASASESYSISASSRVGLG